MASLLPATKRLPLGAFSLHAQLQEIDSMTPQHDISASMQASKQQIRPSGSARTIWSIAYPETHLLRHGAQDIRVLVTANIV
jgi:hypothetical protein